MRIEVRDRGFKPTEALRNYVGLRLMSVLDHLVRQVDGVTVCLADTHAPEGGVDKRCRMLALLPSGEVCVDETDPGLYAAIDRAAERLAHGVALELARPAMTPAARLAQVRPGAVAAGRSRGLTGISRAAHQMEST